eukprot:TRINITY_DN5011_c0_g2_i1.p1 TRINITY_DN5011_c0_g2~~TRINITY_DN5011_c0_g2_i1.p1  ORF type:complete len:164 (+),score=22.51 TRINITY_DN5011_c0_g2_i1:60-551(+)
MSRWWLFLFCVCYLSVVHARFETNITLTPPTTIYELSVGITASMSGAQASAGQATPVVLQMFQDHYYTRSRLPAMGFKINFFLLDTFSTSPGTTAATNAVVSYGASVVLGAEAGLCLDSASAAERNGVIHIAGQCGNPSYYICDSSLGLLFVGDCSCGVVVLC